ncbi:MAG: glycoside hydrolase family 2 TIM barrel-domain containing protein [Christensenellales bacterium]
MNLGWHFSSAGRPGFKIVDLPHDAMIHEKRDANCKNGQNTGYFPGGKYVYERSLIASEEWKNKYVAIRFEGVYRHSRVWLNHVLLGTHANGYTPFELELTGLKAGENHIRVEIDNSGEPNSRWYTGSGIYRPVWLIVKEKDHIRNLRIETLSYAPPTIRVTCSEKDASVTVSEGKTALYMGSCGKIIIPNAVLWSAETPVLYKCTVKTDTDSVTQYFGIRKLEWNARTGLLVNGKPVKLRGGCIHHDNGLLGACAFRDAEYRKVRILKEAGFNAIRCAHNPCSEALLDACDELGMYVMDEAFDQWYMPKTKYDYARDFAENYRMDFAAMVNRDRNHPSVILYSIGNEVSETAQQQGIALTEEMVKLAHSLDDTRPVTCGINLFLNGLISKGIGIYSEDGEGMADKAKDENSRMSKLSGSTLYNAIMENLSTIKNIVSLAPFADKATSAAFAKLDICGYNYGTARYIKDGKKYPQRLIVGSETYIPGLYDTWKRIETHSYLVGDFIWTAWDYLGESGIGAWRYDKGGFQKPYPMLTAGCGVISITGRPDPMLYYAQACYGKQPVLKIAVRPVELAGEKCARSPWRMTDAVESWDWPGCEGKIAYVEVYTTAHHVRLLLNGKKVGTRKSKKAVCRFRLPWRPGELVAVGYDKSGKKLDTMAIRSASGVPQLRITPSRHRLHADGQSLVWVDIAVTDAYGTPYRSRNVKISMETKNIDIQALGTDRVSNPESYTDFFCTTHLGYAQAILRAGTQSGTAKVTVTAEGIDSQTFCLELEKYYEV